MRHRSVAGEFRNAYYFQFIGRNYAKNDPFTQASVFSDGYHRLQDACTCHGSLEYGGLTDGKSKEVVH